MRTNDGGSPSLSPNESENWVGNGTPEQDDLWRPEPEDPDTAIFKLRLGDPDTIIPKSRSQANVHPKNPDAVSWPQQELPSWMADPLPQQPDPVVPSWLSDPLPQQGEKDTSPWRPPEAIEEPVPVKVEPQTPYVAPAEQQVDTRSETERVADRLLEVLQSDASRILYTNKLDSMDANTYGLLPDGGLRKYGLSLAIQAAPSIGARVQALTGSEGSSREGVVILAPSPGDENFIVTYTVPTTNNFDPRRGFGHTDFYIPTEMKSEFLQNLTALPDLIPTLWRRSDLAKRIEQDPHAPKRRDGIADETPVTVFAPPNLDVWNIEGRNQQSKDSQERKWDLGSLISDAISQGGVFEIRREGKLQVVVVGPQKRNSKIRS